MITIGYYNPFFLIPASSMKNLIKVLVLSLAFAAPLAISAPSVQAETAHKPASSHVKAKVKPTAKPTTKPTTKPTAKPVTKPTAKPTAKPTKTPKSN